MSVGYWCPNGCGKKVRFYRDRGGVGVVGTWRCDLCGGVFTRKRVMKANNR